MSEPKDYDYDDKCEHSSDRHDQTLIALAVALDFDVQLLVACLHVGLGFLHVLLHSRQLLSLDLRLYC